MHYQTDSNISADFVLWEIVLLTANKISIGDELHEEADKCLIILLFRFGWNFAAVRSSMVARMINALFH